MCPTGEIFAINGVGFAPTTATTIIVAWANWSPSVYPTGEIFAIGGVSHGRNIRHKWRGFRPYVGIDNDRGMGELVAMGVVPTTAPTIIVAWANWSPSVYPTGEIFAINGVGFAPTTVSTLIMAWANWSPSVYPTGEIGDVGAMLHRGGVFQSSEMHQYSYVRVLSEANISIITHFVIL